MVSQKRSFAGQMQSHPDDPSFVTTRVSRNPVLYSTFANAHNGYGDFVDLEQATLDDCAAFFDTFYAPANAVLTVAGDFTPDTARKLIEKHFGDVPFRPAPPRRSFAEPPPAGEVRGEHTDPHAPLPALAVGYRMPDYSAADAVTARATGPRGIVCVASATLAA